jgi:hypothetical protein
VYHALFYTALYLSKDEAHFHAWPEHNKYYNTLGDIAFDGQPIIITTTYSKQQLNDYLHQIMQQVVVGVDESTFEMPPAFTG